MKRKLPRAISLLLSLCMALGMLQLPVLAAETPANLTVPAGETMTVTENMTVGKVELEGTVSADYPVVVFYTESDDVENGQVINNVQFVCDYDEVVAMVHTNDVHGYIEVEPYVKGLADSLRASGDYSLVLTISAGDVYGAGAAVAGSYDGEFIPAIMDAVYDITVPGNNDYGKSGAPVRHNLLLTSLYENTVTLCANLLAIEEGLALAEYAAGYTSMMGNELFVQLYPQTALKADGSLDLSALELADVAGGVNPYQPTITYTTGKGTVIGLYGITTNGGACSTEVDPQGSISAATASVESLQAEGAEVIVGVVHTGWMGEESAETSSNDTNTWQMATRMTGQDALIDSHTHSVINDGEGILVNGTFINQAVCFGSCIGVMYLYLKDGEVVAVDGENITDMSAITPDAGVQYLVGLANVKVEEDLGQTLATTVHFLNGERLSAANAGGSVRGNETNLGDLMTDVIRAALSEREGVDYDFCHYPGYWLRASIEGGDIKLADIQSVFANPTALHEVEYTAAEVVSMVEKGLSSVYPEKEGTTFNHYSGITVTYTNNGGTGTPVTIHVGDTLIYDANNGGVQVDDSWSCKGIFTLTGGEIDNWTGSKESWLCSDKAEVQTLVADYLSTHERGVDYVIHPNTVAPDGRITAVGSAGGSGTTDPAPGGNTPPEGGGTPPEGGMPDMGPMASAVATSAQTIELTFNGNAEMDSYAYAATTAFGTITPAYGTAVGGEVVTLTVSVPLPVNIHVEFTGAGGPYAGQSLVLGVEPLDAADPDPVEPEIDEDGRTPTESIRFQYYTVAAGDTLWSIARELYGTGTRWSAIYQANADAIREAGKIFEGQVLDIPPR